MKTGLPNAGDVFTVVYPFSRDLYDDGDPDSGGPSLTWKPGGDVLEDYRGRMFTRCHGEGNQEITVVSVHQPPGFPTRVFYTRKWIDPDGQRFGKNKLLIATADKFRRTVRGYAYGISVVPYQPPSSQEQP